MKFLASLLFLSLFVVSCGSNPPPKPPAAPPPPTSTVPTVKGWNQAQFDGVISNCTTNGPIAYPQFNAQQWALYCPCLATIIASNWTNPEWNNNPYAILNQINTQVSDQQCQDKAFGSGGQPTPRDVSTNNVWN